MRADFASGAEVEYISGYAVITAVSFNRLEFDT
jgi:hypothetical protein